MGVRPEIVERKPFDEVEVEYALTSSARRSGRKPRFSRARMLSVATGSLEIGSREAFFEGDKLSLTVHAKRIRNFLRLDVEVVRCSRVTVLRQQAFCVEMRFGKLPQEDMAKVAWLIDQFMPKRPQRPIRRVAAPPEPAAPVAKEVPKAAPVAAPPVPAAERVKRPVALLELIRKLDSFEVSNDLIWAVIEAAEAGMDVEALFPVEGEEEAPEEEEESAAALPTASSGPVRPVRVYRLAANTSLPFGSDGVPASPASEMIYFSRLPPSEKCFAVELGVDSMAHPGWPTFPTGTVCVFSTAEAVSSGDFAFVKVRGRDYFGQVFMGDKENVRVRFLNPGYPEITASRHEVRVMCKLVGYYISV